MRRGIPKAYKDQSSVKDSLTSYVVTDSDNREYLKVLAIVSISSDATSTVRVYLHNLP